MSLSNSTLSGSHQVLTPSLTVHGLWSGTQEDVVEVVVGRVVDPQWLGRVDFCRQSVRPTRICINLTYSFLTKLLQSYDLNLHLVILRILVCGEKS